jgi:hypothetical protein
MRTNLMTHLVEAYWIVGLPHLAVPLAKLQLIADTPSLRACASTSSYGRHG